jgi:hypothetical protein
MEFTYEGAISILWQYVEKRRNCSINAYQVGDEKIISLIKKEKTLIFRESSKNFSKLIKKYC